MMIATRPSNLQVHWYLKSHSLSKYLGTLTKQAKVLYLTLLYFTLHGRTFIKVAINHLA